MLSRDNRGIVSRPRPIALRRLECCKLSFGGLPVETICNSTVPLITTLYETSARLCQKIKNLFQQWRRLHPKRKYIHPLRPATVEAQSPTGNLSGVTCNSSKHIEQLDIIQKAIFHCDVANAEENL